MKDEQGNSVYTMFRSFGLPYTISVALHIAKTPDLLLSLAEFWVTGSHI